MLEFQLGKELKKNESINLDSLVFKKEGPTEFKVGLSWDIKPGQKSDLDVVAALLGTDGKIHSNDHLIFYNNRSLPHQEDENGKQDGIKKQPDTVIFHWGDERTGATEGDDETIDLKLDRVSPEIERIVITVSAYPDPDPLTFGRVKNASIRLYTLENDTIKDTVASFDLTEDLSTSTAMLFIEFYRSGNGWNFRALGTHAGTSPNGLEDIVKQFS